MPYDVIPPGKKQIKDPRTGDWILVDLDTKNPDDLQKLLDAERAKVADLEEQVKMLKAENAKLKGKAK